MRIPLALLFAAAVSIASSKVSLAQDIIRYNITEEGITEERVSPRQSSSLEVVNGKRLPPGYHGFRSIEPKAVMAQEVGIVCREMKKAISVAQRQFEGNSPTHSFKLVNSENNRPVCGILPDDALLIRTAVAVRGGDHGLKVAIFRYIDKNGGLHYEPVRLAD